MIDPKDYIADHDLDDDYTELDPEDEQDAWERHQQMLEDLAMDED